jgi:Delta7-sterol 5-desaturase
MSTPHSKTERASPDKNESMSKTWNWHPTLPMTTVPYWLWPPKPIALAKWLWAYWLQMSDRNIYLVFAFMVAYWLQPVTDIQAEFSSGWISAVVLRNYIAIILVAGGLHLWLYGVNGQGHRLKYDPRSMSRKKSKFFMNNQTFDNMFFTLCYAVPIASGYEVLTRFLYANDHFVMVGFSSHPIWFILLFPILTMYQGLHFYLVHRPLHWPLLYRHVHSIHHRNPNPGPWSGLSMHPFEHLLYFSSLLIFFVLPSHPVHMLFLLFWQLLGAPSGHSGYEAVWVKGKSRLKLSGFFHQVHHRYFECNYGNAEFPFDKWFNTYHDGTDESTKAMRQRGNPLSE